MIPVTKPYLPNREKLNKYIDGIYERNWLTNNGPLVQELTKRLEKYLGVENLLLVTNGTLALQVAYHALGITNGNKEQSSEVITTPFTFVATASSLKWEGIKPVFVDIDSETWCLDTKKIEAAINTNTSAIVPVHVFGNACDVEQIHSIAHRHNLKVVYDAAHAFGIKYKGESLLKWGDAATLSFHATKVFHSIEGGAIIFKRKEDLDIAKKMINFGISGPDTIEEGGINAKMSEFQAAMGLCVLDEMDENLSARSNVWDTYGTTLKNSVQMQRRRTDLSNNYAYFPLVMENEDNLIDALALLKEKGVVARRYFYPSLNEVSAIGKMDDAPISSEISRRVMCLPIYSDLSLSEIQRIVSCVKGCCK